MKKNDFIGAVAAALEVEADIVTMDLKIDDIPEWDSLGHLTILSSLDDLNRFLLINFFSFFKRNASALALKVIVILRCDCKKNWLIKLSG